MKKNTTDNFERYSPSGACRMGDTEVTYYRMTNGRLWLDKKAVEFVLTRKNQHNLLGQYKDPKNHSRIFDTAINMPIDVISPAGVKNYLKKAWSVSDENRRTYFEGLKNLDKPNQEAPAEPFQMPMFNAALPISMNDFVKISKNSSGKLDVEYFVSGNTVEEKNRNLVKMLLYVASGIADGSLAAQGI